MEIRPVYMDKVQGGHGVALVPTCEPSRHHPCCCSSWEGGTLACSTVAVGHSVYTPAEAPAWALQVVMGMVGCRV